MPTTFIAVQCCQCATMQVKQQKKSSNKWTCVVCNQKQSVLKVFAQAFMAKDVREFVQTFNTNRRFSDQQSIDEESLAPTPSEEIKHPFSSYQKKARTDWTEYLDSKDEGDRKFEDNDEETGDLFEPKVVMEFPKALFKKPKLKNHSGVPGTERGVKSYTPFFTKRNPNKQNRSLDKESSPTTESVATMVGGTPKWCDQRTYNRGTVTDKEPVTVRHQSTMTARASKWSDYLEKDDNFADEETRRQGPTPVKGASKWNGHITQSDNDNELPFVVGRTSADDRGLWSHSALETILNDQVVEEEIHPDFQS